MIRRHGEVDMGMPAERQKVRFTSGGTECAAWYYPGTTGACVVMAGGFAVTKEPATDQFARRFSEAGLAVLAPRGELVRLPGGHYAPFLEQHERAVEAELAFLRRHLLDPARAARPAAAAADSARR